MAVKITGEPLTNIPWEEKPAGAGVMWRYSGNPVIPRDLIPCSNSIFNSAVVPFQGKFAGVFRVDDTSRQMQLHTGRSADGLTWELDAERISFICDDDEIGNFVYGYDPRVVWIEDRYYVTWCNWFHGPTIGVAYTYDFEKYYQLENAFLPFNRNGVLFPRKINGNFAMVSRPSDNGHTPFGDIFLQRKPGHAVLGQTPICFLALLEVGRVQKLAQAPSLSRPLKGGCSYTTACLTHVTVSFTAPGLHC